MRSRPPCSGFLLGWLFLFLASPAWAAEKFESIYISEILSESRRGAGWIELHNGGLDSVNLADWYLSDAPTNLMKRRLPKVVMLPDSFFVISASGAETFSLDPKGGQLVLSRGGSNLVSEIAYPKSKSDVSYGRVRGEPGVRGEFDNPSPGKPNQSKGKGFAPAVVFSRPSGPFTSSLVLALTCETASGTNRSGKPAIRYTLDGSFPNSSSPIYNEALRITNTTAVRARAFQEGLLPGPPASEVYVALASNVLEFRSSLPVFVMNTMGNSRPEKLRSPYILLHEPKEGKTGLSNRPTLVTRGGFHVRGSSSASFPQPSLAVEFVDEFNDDQNHPVLGLPPNSDWVLYAPNMFDPGLIHNPFVHQLSRDMGHYSSRTRFVEVFVVVHPGAVTAQDYAGVFVLEEKIKIGKGRLAIDKLGADDLEEPDVTGGYLMKFDRLGPGEQGLWAGGTSMVHVDPKEEVINLPQREPQRRYIANYLDELSHALQGPDWRDPIKGYPAYIDVNAWIDYHVLELLSGNVDIFRYSTFFYKPRGGKLTFGPHWDFDRALGSIDRRDANPRRWNTGRFFDGAWWRQVFRDPDFWQLWVDRWQALRRTDFSETNLFRLIDSLADEVREAQPRQAARWNLYPRGGAYQSEIDWMKTWLRERMKFIDAQLAQPPMLAHGGGQVGAGFQLKLTGQEGAVIYYTVDGSDPRESQGELSAKALEYKGPIAIDREVEIKVRSYNPEIRQINGPPVSTPWSSAISARFTVESSTP